MSGRLDIAFINRVKDEVSRLDLIADSVYLRPGRYRTTCPLCGGDCLDLNSEANLFYCYGCRVGGDAIGWVQMTRKLGFQDAVRWLAERYGLPAEYEQGR